VDPENGRGTQARTAASIRKTGRDSGEVFVFTATQVPRDQFQKSVPQSHTIWTRLKTAIEQKPDVIRQAVEDHLKMQFPDEKAIAVTSTESKTDDCQECDKSRDSTADRVVDEMKRQSSCPWPCDTNPTSGYGKAEERIADLEKKKREVKRGA